MKFTIALTMVVAIVSSTISIATYDRFFKEKIVVLGINMKDKKLLAKAEDKVYTKLKYNYTNRTTLSQKEYMMAKMKYDDMKSRAAKAIAARAIEMVKSGKASIVIPEGNVLYADSTVKRIIN